MIIRHLVSLGVDPTKLFFLRFFFFGIKLGHFTIQKFFLYATKTQAYQQKTEEFFVSEEKKFGRIDFGLIQFKSMQFLAFGFFCNSDLEIKVSPIWICLTFLLGFTKII